MIDDESLVKTRTNTCLSYTSAVPSYSVPKGIEYYTEGHLHCFLRERYSS